MGATPTSVRLEEPQPGRHSNGTEIRPKIKFEDWGLINSPNTKLLVLKILFFASISGNL